ncbi:MAG: methyltransferase [Candidatus Altarchaeum sp.]|nr:methyltransferase [Candidatus Altarchaeum sp.]
MAVYKLIPTKDYPALMIDGILMHCIKWTSPKNDAENKMKILGIKKGRILDICTGLGYTAIVASYCANEVVTIEKDENVIEIAKNNKFSQELFANKNINSIIGDAYDEIQKFDDKSFDYILHDPPTVSRAGELYGKVFYENLYRILKPHGKLFHYVSNPGSKYRNRTVEKGIVNRLRGVGFDVKIYEEVSGVVCVKV